MAATKERSKEEAPAELVASVGITNPLVLLQSMIERGADPDALKKMMDLAERFQANEARKVYDEAMNASQAEIIGVVKDKQNSHTQSAYVALETIQEAARPIYTKHGFALSWTQADLPPEANPNKLDLIRFICQVSHKAGHTKLFQGDYPRDGVGAKGGSNMNALQGTVSAATYCQRDMIRLIFNVTIAGMDKDGNVVGLRLSGAEIKLINDGLEDCRQVGSPVDFKRFLVWLTPRGRKQPIESLEEVLQADLPRALDHLRLKRGEIMKKGNGS